MKLTRILKILFLKIQDHSLFFVHILKLFQLGIIVFFRFFFFLKPFTLHFSTYFNLYILNNFNKYSDHVRIPIQLYNVKFDIQNNRILVIIIILDV